MSEKYSYPDDIFILKPSGGRRNSAVSVECRAETELCDLYFAMSYEENFDPEKENDGRQ